MPMPLSGLAQTLSNSVARVQAEIVDTQEQLASGTKELNPGQAGVVTRLSAQVSGYDTTLTNIGAAQSVISVGQASLTSIASVLTQMQSLANQASSSGLSSSDRDSLQATFSNLASQVASLGTSSSVNGNNLLAGNNLSVTTGIDGSSSATTTVSGVNIATVASTLAGLSVNASVAAPTVTTVADVKQIDTVALAITTADASGTSYTIGGLTFTLNSTGGARTKTQQIDDIGTAFANYINNGTATNTYGTFSNSSVAAMQALFSGAVNTSGSLALTRAVAGTQTVASFITTSTHVTSTPTISTAAVNQKDTVSFTAALTSGQAISVGGLVYTAKASGATAINQAADFYAFINAGTAGTYGTFSGTSYASMSSKYTPTNPSGAASLLLTYTNSYTGAQTAISGGDNGVTNAKAAIASITTQLQTVSTAQATLSASATGLTAQASANTALKTGLTNTVNSIQNIDATAMQAKLQQLNNQQSIDYYLVSQMNTEAAAILSIFR